MVRPTVRDFIYAAISLGLVTALNLPKNACADAPASNAAIDNPVFPEPAATDHLPGDYPSVEKLPEGCVRVMAKHTKEFPLYGIDSNGKSYKQGTITITPSVIECKSDKPHKSGKVKLRGMIPN